MKKYILSLILLLSLMPAFSFSLSDSYTHNSSFWRNTTSLLFAPKNPFLFGAEFDITEHKDFAHHIYAVRAPFGVSTREFTFLATPFFLPDNANDSWAYGGKIMLSTGVKLNDIDATAAEGYLSAGIASQKAEVYKTGFAAQRETFAQAAYELGAVYNFFGVYSFHISGNIYHYLSGLSGVEGMKSVLNQNELADLGTLDYVLGMPRGSAGLKISWRSEENHTETFVSYRYIDRHNDDPMHSALLSTNIVVGGKSSVRLSYNHIFIPNDKDRDIYGAGFNLSF